MGPREKVLVVDDDAELLESLRVALTQAGFAAEVARDGQEALAWMLAAPADLVVADVRMPRMGGLELIRALRARGLPQPVVLVTGSDTRDLCTGAPSYGAAACLTKPVAIDDLVWTIERTLACQLPAA